MNKHKHHDLIVAWAAGAEIQCEGKPGEWFVIDTPIWDYGIKYRIKPAAPKWPETTMTFEDLKLAEESKAGYKDTLFAIANAALRHACETGQLVLPDPERDMKIAKAVRHAVIDAWGNVEEHEEYAAMSNVDLAAIINEATK